MIKLNPKFETTELERFSNTLKRYRSVSGKTEDEVLNKKGNDLRIQLGKLYQKQKWKGGKSIAEREGRRRFKQGKGTLVRAKYILDRYDGKAPIYQKRKPSSRKRRGKLVDGVRQKGTYKTGTNSRLVKTTFWQKLVWQEWQRRQRGRGVLGVGFFSKRWRYLKNKPRYLSENKSKSVGSLVRIVKGEHYFRITGFTEGLDKVANRYGVIDQAIRNVRKDTERYFENKTINALKGVIKRRVA